MNLILTLQAFASLNLMGLIWCIQWVHYPMFDRLEKERATQSIAWHGQRISWVVAPLMLLELTCATYLWLFPPRPSWIYSCGLALVAGLWLTTALVQVPLHGRLSRNFTTQDVASLVRGNLNKM